MKLFQKSKRHRYTFQFLIKGTSNVIYESKRSFRTLKYCKSVAALIARTQGFSPLKIDINIAAV